MAPRGAIGVFALAAFACGGSSRTGANAPVAELSPSNAPAPNGAAVPPGSAEIAGRSVEATTENDATESKGSEPAEHRDGGEPCGALDCRRFGTAREAFRYVLGERPLVLGIGEAHALSGAPHVDSSARRFSDELLVELEGRASHLIVELINPNPACQQATREVERVQKPVTSEQSLQNQNDYVALGHHARRLGIEPFVLSPTCDELSAIAQAGSDGLDRMLATIASVTARMVLGALNKNAHAAREQLVLAYGGALHNDESPEPERASWSYGPRLLRATGGRYVALDLIVREFIKDSDVWRALPWYEHFDPERDPDSAIVMRTAAHSYVLFFPKSRAGAGPAR